MNLKIWNIKNKLHYQNKTINNLRYTQFKDIFDNFIISVFL